MRRDTLEILRCPYCGGRLELVDSLFGRGDGDEIADAVLGCHCCTFPVVSGIPVLHLGNAASAARAQIEGRDPARAARTLLGFTTDADAARFEALAASADATYREIVDALGPDFEGGYFLYRFSDPTYLVSHAVARAVAGTVLGGGGRAIDVCGGSGHLTRSLMDLSRAPVVADLSFAKVWLARRFTAPGCEAVCCDGNAALPFARGVFRFAMCADALHYIWTKRQLVGEMLRLIDDEGAVLVSHTHNSRTWSLSQGQALPPEGYRDLFETLTPRLFSESALFADIVRGGPLDLARHDSGGALDADPALTIVATSRRDVFRAHALTDPSTARGEFRVNPLYASEADGERVRLRLRFPSEDYEQEYGAARLYLAEEVTVDRAALAALPASALPPGLADLARRRVVLDLPKRYY